MCFSAGFTNIIKNYGMIVGILQNVLIFAVY